MKTRREFLGLSTTALAGTKLFGCSSGLNFFGGKNMYKISLAQWSLHRTLNSGDLDNLDFAKVTKNEFGIDAVEYVNQFFFDKKENYIKQMKQRADDEGVRSLLIMCDGEGRLGDPDEKERTKAIENHYKWVEAAKILGCHSIRVNAASDGTYDEQIKLAADGLSRLTEYGAQRSINVIVENHGGLSSNGLWLSTVIKKVNHQRCGTLPDFGNFRMSSNATYDRYKGMKELMPFAKGVSAKSHEFDEQGNEIHSDFLKMMKIVKASGYSGYIGIEYEGSQLSEYEGIKATKKLLERVFKQI
jgi:sugar phosphate isomerase/epimerase